MKKIKLYMALPSTGQREDSQNYTLRKLEKIYGDRIEFVYPEHYVGRIFHDYARCEYVKQFLATDCDIMWFLDSDVIPPTNVLDLITEHGDKWKLAGAPYPVMMTVPGYDFPQVVFTVYQKDDTTKGFHPAAVPQSGTAEVAGLATGCLFIKREVIEKLEEPYFEFKYNPKTREMIEGEDLGFCLKVNKLGYKFFTDFSMVCRHYKRVCLLDVNNYAQKLVEQAIIATEKAFRQALQAKQLVKPKKPESRLILPR